MLAAPTAPALQGGGPSAAQINIVRNLIVHNPFVCGSFTGMPHDPLELDRQLCFSLYRASRTVTRAYRPLLKDIGLTYPQYLVMLALWQSGGPMSLNDIGSRLSLDSGTLTPLLRRLEETGLITRARDRADERRRLITLTSAGRDLRKRAATIPDRMIALYSQPAEDLERLKSMLDDMAARLA